MPRLYCDCDCTVTVTVTVLRTALPDVPRAGGARARRAHQDCSQHHRGAEPHQPQLACTHKQVRELPSVPGGAEGGGSRDRTGGAGR
eukprot:489865-Pyramimonas_sp.AAC.1